MTTINEIIPVKIRAEFFSIFSNCAIGIKGPIPICTIFRTISLLSLLNFLKTIDIKKIKNKYNKIIANFINLSGSFLMSGHYSKF